jgi:integrase
MTIEDRRHKRYWTHGKPREKPWLWRDRATGATQAFKTKAEATEYQERYNVDKRRATLGTPTTKKDLERYKVIDIIHSYMADLKDIPVSDEFEDIEEEMENRGGLAYNVRLVLNVFASRAICNNHTLQTFSEQVAEQYAKDRGKELTKHGKRVSPRTVRWEISHIQLAWKWAKRLPGLSQLPNPWKGIKIHGSTGGKRQRGLKKGELEKLIEACKGCLGNNKYYVPLAIRVAVETAMRRREIVNLNWEDIDFENKRIHIEKSKTDKRTGNNGRNIVLPALVAELLTDIKHQFKPDASSKVFPLTEEGNLWGNALSDAFDKVVNRTDIKNKNLTFHDLRAAAEGMFARAELTPKEIDIVKNGVKSAYDVEEVYLEIIEVKLERYRLGGKTADEWYDEELEYRAELIEEGMKEGLTQKDATAKANAAISEQRLAAYAKDVERLKA